jgi:hypothetical protein
MPKPTHTRRTPAPVIPAELKPRVLHVLRWLKDNQHHTGAWLPGRAPPEQTTHLRLSGYDTRIVIAKSTWTAAQGYITHTVPERPSSDRGCSTRTAAASA